MAGPPRFPICGHNFSLKKAWLYIRWNIQVSRNVDGLFVVAGMRSSVTRKKFIHFRVRQQMHYGSNKASFSEFKWRLANIRYFRSGRTPVKVEKLLCPKLMTNVIEDDRDVIRKIFKGLDLTRSFHSSEIPEKGSENISGVLWSLIHKLRAVSERWTLIAN